MRDDDRRMRVTCCGTYRYISRPVGLVPKLVICCRVEVGGCRVMNPELEAVSGRAALALAGVTASPATHSAATAAPTVSTGRRRLLRACLTKLTTMDSLPHTGMSYVAAAGEPPRRYGRLPKGFEMPGKQFRK